MSNSISILLIRNMSDVFGKNDTLRRRSAIDEIFFFSSRIRHTRYIGDWSSDVCSSDLDAERVVGRGPGRKQQSCSGVGGTLYQGRRRAPELQAGARLVAGGLRKTQHRCHQEVAAAGQGSGLPVTCPPSRAGSSWFDECAEDDPAGSVLASAGFVRRSP